MSIITLEQFRQTYGTICINFNSLIKVSNKYFENDYAVTWMCDEISSHIIHEVAHNIHLYTDILTDFEFSKSWKEQFPSKVREEVFNEKKISAKRLEKKLRKEGFLNLYSAKTYEHKIDDKTHINKLFPADFQHDANDEFIPLEIQGISVKYNLQEKEKQVFQKYLSLILEKFVPEHYKKFIKEIRTTQGNPYVSLKYADFSHENIPEDKLSKHVKELHDYMQNNQLENQETSTNPCSADELWQTIMEKDQITNNLNTFQFVTEDIASFVEASHILGLTPTHIYSHNILNDYFSKNKNRTAKKANDVIRRKIDLLLEHQIIDPSFRDVLNAVETNLSSNRDMSGIFHYN